MKLVLKDSIVLATHDDDQIITFDTYPSADAIVSVSGNYNCGATYIATSGEIASNVIEMLWNSATNYQAKRCDGNGVAAIVGKAVQGAMTGTTYVKANANQAWWQGIWTDYNTRKAGYLSDPTSAVNFDFSNNGDLPYSIADMMSE